MTPTIIIPGARFGEFEAVSIDASGRRVVCRCECTKLVTVSAEALLDGTRASCGCGESSWLEQADTRARANEQRAKARFNVASKP